MRNVPGVMFLFFVVIQILRVAAFIGVGLHAEWMGLAFSIGLAVSVYVSSYFVRYAETRWAAICGLAVFMLADLWMNEGELIRTLSAVDLITPASNFLGWNADTLAKGMQYSALVFGALPTIASAILGWLQAGASRIKVLKGRTANFSWGVAVAAKLEKWFPEIADVAENGRPQIVDGQVKRGKIGKGQISAEQRALIASLPEDQIVARFGGSARRARMWKQEIRNGRW